MGENLGTVEQDPRRFGAQERALVAAIGRVPGLKRLFVLRGQA